MQHGGLPPAFYFPAKELKNKIGSVLSVANREPVRLFINMLDEMGVKRIPIDEAISAKASELVEQYSHSHSVHAGDSLIAATALVHNLPLATGNVKHFSPIPNPDLHTSTN